MATSSERYEAQCEADRKHHQDRVKWLESENPTWACGTPVRNSERASMLKASKAYNRHTHYNSAPPVQM